MTGRFTSVVFADVVFGKVALLETTGTFAVILRDGLMETFDDGTVAMPVPLGNAMSVEDELDPVENSGLGAVVGIRLR